MIGTHLYTPPEIHTGTASDEDIHDLYKSPVDIWAFGVLSFRFLSGQWPFFNEDERCDSALLSHRIRTIEIPKEPLRRQGIKEPVIGLITNQILNHNHERRITANGILGILTTLRTQFE